MESMHAVDPDNPDTYEKIKPDPPYNPTKIMFKGADKGRPIEEADFQKYPRFTGEESS